MSSATESQRSEQTVNRLDPDWVRARFPALESDWVLFDNAGGSAPLGNVIERISTYMSRWPVQLGASYAPSATASERLDASRAALAGLLAGGGEAPSPNELVIASSTTELMQRLARALGESLGPNDEVIVTDVDHEANISPWRRLAERGVVIREWQLNRESQRLELDELRPLLNERTRLVCFTHASNLLGEVNDVRAITALVHAAGAQVCVDGVAYAPHRPLALKAWDVDFYAFSLYKVYGPHCALLYGRDSLLAELPNLNHSFYRREDVPGKLEPGAYPYELLYGAAGVPDYLAELGAAIGDGLDPMADAYRAIEDQEHRLTTQLLDYLNARAGVSVCGVNQPLPERLPTVSFSVEGHRASEIPPICDAEGVGIRWGHFYAPRLVEALGLTERDGVIRVSMVHYNTEDEVRRLTDVLDRAW